MGETVDRKCLLDVIPESVLLRKKERKLENPAAYVSFVLDYSLPPIAVDAARPPPGGAAAPPPPETPAPTGTRVSDGSWRGDSGGGGGGGSAAAPPVGGSASSTSFAAANNPAQNLCVLLGFPFCMPFRAKVQILE